MPTAPGQLQQMNWGNYTAGQATPPPWQPAGQQPIQPQGAHIPGKAPSGIYGKGKPLVSAYSGKGKMDALPIVMMPPEGIPAGIYAPKGSNGKVFLPIDRWCKNPQCPHKVKYGSASQIRNHQLVSFPKTVCKHCKVQVLDPDDPDDNLQEQFIWRNQIGMVLWLGGHHASCFWGSKLYGYAQQGWGLEETIEYLRQESLTKPQRLQIQQQYQHDAAQSKAAGKAKRGSSSRGKSRGPSGKSDKGDKGDSQKGDKGDKTHDKGPDKGKGGFAVGDVWCPPLPAERESLEDGTVKQQRALARQAEIAKRMEERARAGDGLPPGSSTSAPAASMHEASALPQVPGKELQQLATAVKPDATQAVPASHRGGGSVPQAPKAQPPVLDKGTVQGTIVQGNVVHGTVIAASTATGLQQNEGGWYQQVREDRSRELATTVRPPFGSAEWRATSSDPRASQPEPAVTATPPTAATIKLLKPALKAQGSPSSAGGSRPSSRGVSIKDKDKKAKRWADDSTAGDGDSSEDLSIHFSHPQLAKKLSEDIIVFKNKAESDPAFHQMVATLQTHLDSLLINDTDGNAPPQEPKVKSASAQGHELIQNMQYWQKQVNASKAALEQATAALAAACEMQDKCYQTQQAHLKNLQVHQQELWLAASYVEDFFKGMAMDDSLLKLINDARANPIQHGPLGALAPMPWPTPLATEGVNKASPADQAAAQDALALAARAKEQLELQGGGPKAHNAMEVTTNARASKRKPAEDGDDKAPTSPAELDHEDKDDASRASRASKGSKTSHVAASVSSGSVADADNPWLGPFVVHKEDKAVTDLAVFDEKKLGDPEYVKMAKEVTSKYVIDFEQWKVGITVHKANCIDPDLTDLRETLGITTKLINPKVKEEPSELDNSVFGAAEIVAPVGTQSPTDTVNAAN